jgi:hypothetical protein
MTKGEKYDINLSGYLKGHFFMSGLVNSRTCEMSQ